LRPTPRKQRTLARSAAVEGFGYWSGRDVRIEFRPAPADAGVVFFRDDLPKPIPIAVAVQNRLEAPRRTTLSAPGATVEMVEHILAALAGLRIDNCHVHATAAEMPGCDGSSLAFVAALKEAGTVEQNALRAQLVVTEPTRVGDEECWVEASPAPKGGLTLRYRLDYGPDNPIGRETIELKVTPDSFERELAPARTFLLKHEANWLRAQGLGMRATYRDLLVFDDRGPIENELRFENECVRHKTLDLLGDLALAGCDLVGRITAHRSGHRQNAELVRMLLKEGQKVYTSRSA
jgi:UDP-3-O-acyl N-acetylglucosamine deacetylase